MDKKVTVPSENQFCLSKVKLAKGGGLDVHYEVIEVVGDESYINKYHVESAKDIHPDLQNLFKELTPIIARIFNINSFLSVVESKEFEATKKQKAQARESAVELYENIEPRGISLSGKGDNCGVIITAVYTCAEGKKTCLNTPRMLFSTFSYGFEEKLEQICADIEKETYAFLFKGKKAQLELFDGVDDLTVNAEIETEDEQGAED